MNMEFFLEGCENVPKLNCGAGALGRPRGMVWGGRRDQYNLVQFKKKIKLKKKN